MRLLRQARTAFWDFSLSAPGPGVQDCVALGGTLTPCFRMHAEKALNLAVDKLFGVADVVAAADGDPVAGGFGCGDEAATAAEVVGAAAVPAGAGSSLPQPA